MKLKIKWSNRRIPTGNIALITLELYCKIVRIVRNPMSINDEVIKAVSKVDTALLQEVWILLAGALHKEKRDLQASSVQSL